MDNITSSIVTILTAVIGVAILSVLVSRNSNTVGVISAGGSAFSGVLSTALSPVTSGGALVNVANNSLLTGANGLTL